MNGRLLSALVLLVACGDSGVDLDVGIDLPDAALDSAIDATATGMDAAFDASNDVPNVDGGGTDAGAPQTLKAFPSAFGGGAEASGGRGGVLIIVNSSDPSAPLEHFVATDSTPERYEGGFYAALRHDGAAYITFDRSMNIEQVAGGTGTVFSGLGIPGVHDKTLFGQSAPRGGITITGGTLSFNGRTEATRNLIFRYFRSRPILDQDGRHTTEADLYTWGLLFRNGEDIIVDHCSFSFAQDKGLGAAVREPGEHNLERLTFSRNFVSDTHTGIYVEINPGRPGDPEEYVDRISFYSNLTVGMNRTPNVAFDGFAEVVGSVIYGSIYKASTMYHDLRINMIGNYYRTPEGRGMGFNRIFDHGDEGLPTIFAEGNYYEGLLEGVAGENNQVIFKFRDEYDSSVDSSYFVASPFDSPNPHPPPVGTAAQALASVVTAGDVGAYRYLDDEGRAQTYRDDYDSAQLEAVADRADVTHDEVEYWVLPELPMSTRPASYDTDQDGLADAWERRVVGDLSQSYGDDHDGDGYENIEEYMNQVDG